MPAHPPHSGCPIQGAGLSGKAQRSASSTTKTDIVRMELTGASPTTAVEGANQLPGTANYFIGNDPTKWHANVPTYSQVSYKNVYPGVDLLYYGNQRQLEYDFIVQPQANPTKIKLHFSGAKKLTLSPNGDLEVIATNGQIAFHKPVLYQIKQGQRQLVEGTFTLLAKNEVGFQVGTYDHSSDLIIDPVLEYSTYLGSTGTDYAAGITTDAEGNAYVTGYTYSEKFPTTAKSYQPTSSYTANTSQSAVFVSKLNATGTELVYSTYLTGTEYHCSEGPNDNALTVDGDYGSAIAVDSSGDAYVTGGTCANDFPTTKGAYQTAYPSQHHANNVFITKLNPAGSALLYSTYLGGIGASSSGDWANAIAIDAAGDAYVTGQTFSPDFPTTKGAFQTTPAGGDTAFVSKMNPTGTALVYSTYLGGAGHGTTSGDSGSAIAINSKGNAYVTGYTYSNNFPTTTGAYQKTNKAYAISGSSPFVTELNTTGTALDFSTLVGGSTQTGSLQDSANGIALDAAGNVYIAGGTASTDFPTTKGAYQTKDGSSGVWANGFITKLNPSGTALVYSTYLGGSGSATAQSGDRVEAIALDALGDVFLTGYSGSPNFPVTSGAYQKTNKSGSKSETAFLTELNPTGTALVYSTYFGGSGSSANVNGDIGTAIAYLEGRVYFAGVTESTDFPTTTNAYQKKNEATAGKSNAFIAEFEIAQSTTTTLVSDDNPAALGAKVVFTADVTGEDGTPTGTVSFSIDGGTPIKVTLDDTGHAAYSTTALTEGPHSIVATYSGDDVNLPSTSKTFSETITGTTATATPTVSQTITIADATKGYTVYYTTDGTTPTTKSTKYTGPITITSGKTLKFIAVAPGFTTSAVKTVTDTF